MTSYLQILEKLNKFLPLAWGFKAIDFYSINKQLFEIRNKLYI